MTAVAWVLLAALVVVSALWLITLLGAAAKQADMDKAYLQLAAHLLRVTQDRDCLAAELVVLRRARLTVVRPATNIQSAVADRIRGVIAENEASRWDDQWRAFNEDGA